MFMTVPGRNKTNYNYHLPLICISFTDNQIVPTASLDDLLHSVLVRGSDAEPDDEDDDVVQVIAEVHEHGEEPQVTVRKCRSEKHFHYSNQDTRH